MTQDDHTKWKAVRPRRRLIDAPHVARALGQESLRRAQRDHARQPYFDGRRRAAPMAPSDSWDEGLIYASRAGLLDPRSVKPLARQARRRARFFRREFAARPGRRGPRRDADQAAELWLAITLVKKMGQRQGIPVSRPRNGDVRDALQLLFETAESMDTVKKRRQRLRRRLVDPRGARARMSAGYGITAPFASAGPELSAACP